jgi:hypothetical protein
MHTALVSLVAALLPALASASGLAPDPRNTNSYHVLFDLEAHGKIDLVDGYGGYVQVYEDGKAQWIRYCENFDGHGTSGRPNPKRDRFKLLPFGVVDDTAYRCRDYTLADAAIGQPLIAIGNKKLFAMKTDGWSAKDGGEILFQFAKKIPLIGSPTYRTLRIRATRGAGSLNYVVETVIPKTGVFSSHFFLFEVSGSGLGLPNGITDLTIDPTEPTQRAVDLDSLEGATEIRGNGRASKKN